MAMSFVNIAQLVGTENGNVIVPTYDWATFLSSHLKKVPRLKSYHHFTFSASHPGLVLMKEFSDSESSPFLMLNDREWEPQAHLLPLCIVPPGLSNARKWYLYQQIRSFCCPGTEDLVCSKPREIMQDENEDSTILRTKAQNYEVPPPLKRIRRCGLCSAAGHERCTCPGTGKEAL